MTSIEKLAAKHYPEYYSIGLGVDRIGFERGYNLGISSKQEISDEEIKKAANNPVNDAYSFIEGARQYAEQLKNSI